MGHRRKGARDTINIPESCNSPGMKSIQCGTLGCGVVGRDVEEGGRDRIVLASRHAVKSKISNKT